MKKIIYLILALLILIFVSCNKPPKQNKLRIGYTEYGFDQAIVFVLKGILDQQPNLEVELYRVPDDTLYEALANDELDIGISAWMPLTHQNYLEKHPQEIKLHSVLCDSLGLFLAVPEYVNIDRIDDLNIIPEILRNAILIPESQNAIHYQSRDILVDYDLNDFNIQEASWDNIISFVEDSIKNNASFAFITMRPHHSFRKYNLKALDDPLHSLGQYEKAFLVVNSKFPGRMPLIADFLAQVRFNLNDIENIMEMNQVLGSEPYENALRWINQNTRRINRWLLGE